MPSSFIQGKLVSLNDYGDDIVRSMLHACLQHSKVAAADKIELIYHYHEADWSDSAYHWSEICAVLKRCDSQIPGLNRSVVYKFEDLSEDGTFRSVKCALDTVLKDYLENPSISLEAKMTITNEARKMCSVKSVASYRARAKDVLIEKLRGANEEARGKCAA